MLRAPPHVPGTGGASRSTPDLRLPPSAACHFCGKVDSPGGCWYKCLQCPSEPCTLPHDQARADSARHRHRARCAGCDRCSMCMSSPNAWASHDPMHHFFPIQAASDLSHYWIVKHALDKRWDAGPSSAAAILHHGVACAGCRAPTIRGARHKCLLCDGAQCGSRSCYTRMNLADVSRQITTSALRVRLTQTCAHSTTRDTRSFRYARHTIARRTTPREGARWSKRRRRRRRATSRGRKASSTSM